ncbi:MIF4G domain-containing protein A-like [Rhipicephalus microplus]|uniref:MIF4G domain-containing protein A-like n=1 Tax=Rhipicephalus microplus TaxID=6941 RepID=UPI003F6C031D
MAEAAAKFCTRVITAEVDGGFVDRLLWTCRNWFRQLDIPLPRSTYWAPVEPKTQKNTGQKLIAIVKFIAALLSDVPENQGAASMGSLHCGHIFSMAVLLCDSCRLVMISPQLDYEAKVECLHRALTTAGEAAERGAPARMAALVACLRDAFLSSDVPEKARLTLLELVELRASGWKLSLEQQLYYTRLNDAAGD